MTSRVGVAPVSFVLALVLSACETPSIPLEPEQFDQRSMDSGVAEFDIARISVELCGDGRDNDSDGAIDEDCDSCDAFVTRSVYWWATHSCVVRGEANDIAVVPVTLGSSTTFATTADIVASLSGSDYSGLGRLERQLLVTHLNAEHFGLWDVEVVDWDGDGTNETVAWLYDQANSYYDGGSDWSRRFWAAQLKEVTQVGFGGGLWFDDTCSADPEYCDGIDNDGDGTVDEDCNCDEVCDDFDNDGDGRIDEDLDCAPGDPELLQCEEVDECLTLAEAHSIGILTVTSTGFGEEVLVTNSSDTYSVCLDAQAVYYSDDTQPFFWDVNVIDDDTQVGPGESWSSWFGSWTTDNDGYAPYLDEPGWWCLQFSEEIEPGATFNFPGAVVPDALADFVLPGNDSDSDGIDDLLDWVDYAGVQSQHDIWAYQDDHPVLVVGKTAEQGDCEVDVTVMVFNAGALDGSGTITDSIPAGWTLSDASSSPDTSTSEVDGSTTLTWDVAVDGTDFGLVYSEEISYSISYDAGLDLGKVTLPAAIVEFNDTLVDQVNTSTLPVVFDLDLDCDGDVTCPEDEVCDGIDNDHDGEIDEGEVDTDEDGIADCVDEEECDGLDNDGDGAIDEGFDADGDGLADCFDEEECDGLDNDGDGDVDEGFDADGDGLADCFDTEECDGVDNDGDGVIDEGFDADGDGLADCFDEEECDGLDNDGDGAIDEGFDADGDGVADCFDVEECDGLDNDGDGAIDEGFDADGDGVADCFDVEECDGLDNDGDGAIDEGFDSDGDGLADCFDEEECDGLDNDGDGAIDEGFDSDADGLADCFDTEECDGVDNDGDGEIDEGYADTDGDGTPDCLDTEECDGVDNDGDVMIDEGNVCGDGFCEPPPDCLTIWQAHTWGFLLIESEGFGEEIIATNLSDEFSICLDEQIVFTSDDTQAFYWGAGITTLPVELGPGESHSSFYGSYTTDNDGYRPHLGEDDWWCVETANPVTAGAIFDYFGEVIPDALAQYSEYGFDTDSEGTEDLEQWIDWRGVQGQYNIWAEQAATTAMTVGKLATPSGSDVQVTLTVRNFGAVDGTGIVQDSVPAGWTVVSTSPAPDSTTAEGDGSTTLEWTVSVDGKLLPGISSETLTYVISYDAGTDVGYVELDAAGVEYDDGSGAIEMSVSTPGAVYNLDVDGDGTLVCPDE